MLIWWTFYPHKNPYPHKIYELTVQATPCGIVHSFDFWPWLETVIKLTPFHSKNITCQQEMVYLLSWRLVGNWRMLIITLYEMKVGTKKSNPHCTSVDTIHALSDFETITILNLSILRYKTFFLRKRVKFQHLYLHLLNGSLWKSKFPTTLGLEEGSC